MERMECIVYSRTVGWYTPVKNWNPGKKAEKAQRVYYSQEKAINKEFCDDCKE
jgi:anaerobic ribonucleoside-triphosphate reductase